MLSSVGRASLLQSGGRGFKSLSAQSRYFSLMDENRTSKLFFGICGPTGIGKTKVSIAIAKKINAEIISVDSLLIYKGMDIGSAKPNDYQRSLVKHHLIDIINPWESYSVGKFLYDARKIIKDIQSRGKRVLFVGGTMMYFRSLVEGLAPLNPTTFLLQLINKSCTPTNLYQFAKDNGFKNDSHRKAQNLIEITKFLKRRLLPKCSDNNENINGLGNKLSLWALIPKSKIDLMESIENRLQIMIEQGFIQEVEYLKSNPNITSNLFSMKSIGYREILLYLDGCYTKKQLLEKIVISTNQLVKRQLTWIRNWQTEINMFYVDKKDSTLVNCLYEKICTHSFIS